ncbi:cytochrome P450 [Glomus cerebriforme]|uniref:Cytochrome P450 n=1 Tax=Glomus cerebriforme TaxID=658196 RepID=A0A397SUQ0_9GLOM|nr:cytochrome P450 [Glomus cerebriforme]
MVALLFFAIILIITIYYFRKGNKIPKEIENLPIVSGLPIAWAYLRQKNYDEIGDLIRKLSGGHEIYLSRIGIFIVNLASPEYAKILLTESEDNTPKSEMNPEGILYKFFGSGLPFSNGDIWRTSRKIANPAFNNALSPEIVGETTMELFAFMQQNLNRPINVFEVMQRTTIEVLGKLAFGYKFGCLESDETPHIINVYKYIISVIVSPFRRVFPWISKLPIESNKKFLDAIEEFDGFIYDIIESKRNEINKKSSHSRDLLTSMLEFSEQEGINTDITQIKQLRDEMVNFFVAGHDTTSMALSASLYYLAKYPKIQEKARAEVISILGNEPVMPNSDQLKEMKYINAIIKESLRIHPPTPIITLRKLKKPIKFGPYILPVNTACMVNAWQIHHNPKYWENPNQYNPERFLSSDEKRDKFAWIPFSAGPRNCIGQNFSLMEQRVILSMILLKYNWTLPENSVNKEKLLLAPQFLLRPVDLKLVFTERIKG